MALFNDWKELVRAMRNIRAEYNIEPAIKTGPTIICSDRRVSRCDSEETKALALLAKVDPERVTVVKTKADAVIEDDAVQLVVSDGFEVFLPQQDLAKDVKKELDRLSTQLKKLVKDIGGLEGRLGNPGSADKAPADVVAATRASLEEKLEQKATLDASIAELEKQKGTLFIFASILHAAR